LSVSALSEDSSSGASASTERLLTLSISVKENKMVNRIFVNVLIYEISESAKSAYREDDIFTSVSNKNTPNTGLDGEQKRQENLLLWSL
jgi:hypothetical protein